MTVQITSEQATEGGAAGVLADSRRPSTPAAPDRCSGRSEQRPAIERMCDEGEPEIAEALARDLGARPSRPGSGDVASTKAEAVYTRKNLKKWVQAAAGRGIPLAQLAGPRAGEYELPGVIL